MNEWYPNSATLVPLIIGSIRKVGSIFSGLVGTNRSKRYICYVEDAIFL